MADTFKVDILSPDGKIYETQARSLVAPATLGYIGILANHAPIITALVPGVITVHQPDGGVRALDSKSGGFMEVSQNRAVLLIDKA